MRPSVKAEELRKPDMVAVLSRTHLQLTLKGFLMPVFEAISNAIDGIEAHFGTSAKANGQIEIRFVNPNHPDELLVSITDNGIGLNADNYGSFRTPFSGFKLKAKGRGFGRFIAFKVYDRVLYSSRFEGAGSLEIRTFRFDISKESEIVFFDGEPDFAGQGTCVQFNEPLAIWHDLIRKLDIEEVASEIAGHFLPYFLFRWLPKISIAFGDAETQDIATHFGRLFAKQSQGQIECEIDGAKVELEYSLARIPKSQLFKNHCLLFAAASRIVGEPRDLSVKLGATHFVDASNEKYIIVAVVHGDPFETRLNDSRTSLSLSPKDIENIVSIIAERIQQQEHQQIEQIKTRQTVEVSEALNSNPILRIGLRGRSLRDYVATKPNNWDADRFVSDLATERHRLSQELAKQITTAATNKDKYYENIKEIVSKLDSGNKEILAEYVVHRRKILSLVEAARRYSEDGARALEDEIHELVFRRFSDNVETSYFEHNLWLIDDLLAFCPYVNSDRSLHGKGRKKGDKVTDLAFFDDGLILGDEASTTLTIVEFKRPSRDDYQFGSAKSDPVLQVIETLEKAHRAGGITRTDGSYFSLEGVIRKFAFVVADITPTLTNVLTLHDFKRDWSRQSYIRYRENDQVLIQVFGYETLVNNARKRNQAFFSVLFDE